MFAKQLAVMKGQAWNVVETLKCADHGPLELTRRTKVCVWDDLVDIPVAVPMQATAAEVARNISPRESMDEADIAASVPTTKTKVDDLLGFSNVPASTPADMPHPGRFELSSPSGDEATSPTSEHNGLPILGSSPNSLERPGIYPKAVSASYHGRGASLYDSAQRTQQQKQRQRRYSFTPAMRRSSSSMAQRLYDGDDLEGDLGYAAAEGHLGNQRKVIVERLEAVKTSPFFTWC